MEELATLARDTYRLRLAAPEFAARFVPGQFLMLRSGSDDDPLLGRPMALYDTIFDGHGQAVGIDVVFLVVGRLTAEMAGWRPGDEVEVWGPLGNGFAPQATQHLIMVAGGIGQTPFLALAQEYLGKRRYGEPPRSVPRAERVTLCYGARSADLLAGVEDFRRVGVDVHVSTDDGTEGHHGLVTELLERQLSESGDGRRVVCCGPEPMMAAVASVCRAHQVPCQVSLETPMACGLGICFSCVARVRDDNGNWDYRRTCVDGPVFDAERIVF